MNNPEGVTCYSPAVHRWVTVENMDQVPQGTTLVTLSFHANSLVPAGCLRVHRRTVLRQWETAQKESNASKIAAYPLDLLTGPVGSDDDR